MLHVNDHEAERYLKRYQRQQQNIKDRAEREEEINKVKEEAVMSMMKMHRDQIQQLKFFLEDPAENQKEDKILSENKFALIFANEKFSEEYIGMDQLPDVNDDFKNI